MGFWDFPFLLEVSTWQVVVGGLGLSGADREGFFFMLSRFDLVLCLEF